MGVKVYNTLATEDFTGTNGNPLDGDWTDPSIGFVIASNQARTSAVDESAHAYFTGVSIPGWQWAEVTVVNATGIAAGTDNGVGVIVNAQPGTSGDFYYAIMRGATLDLKQCNTNFGDSSVLATKSFTPQANDRLRLESKPLSASSVELRVYLIRGGVETLELGPITDGTHQDGDVGIFSRVAAADVVADGLLDDFEGGEITEIAPVGFGGGNQAWGQVPWGSKPAPAASGGSASLSVDAGSYAITGGAANFKVSIPVDSGSYAITGSAVTPKVSMPAGAGSYTITGGAVNLRAIRTVLAEVGSYIITGSDVTPKVSMPAASGSYTITGANANILAGRKLTLDAGSYTISGMDAALAKGRTLAAESGSYVITGSDASLRATKLLILGGGSYTLSGTDVGLLKGRTLAVESGSYTISGVEAILEAGRRLLAGAGSYIITGGAATFRVALPIGSGSYTITGQDVVLILVAPAKLTAESGSYVISGQDVGLTYSAARRRTGAASQASLNALAWQAEFDDEEDVISYM